MPRSVAAAQDVLDWADSVRHVALYRFVGQWGLQTVGGATGGAQELVTGTGSVFAGSMYARQPVVFGSITDGVRQSTSVLTFNVYANASVAWYGLLDANQQIMAILPHSLSSDNSSKICMFVDTVTGWVDAPDHNLTVNESIVFQSGPHVSLNTYMTIPFDQVTTGFTSASYSTVPYPVGSYGPFFIWWVHEVQANRFRIKLGEHFTTPFVSTSTGWGYYQRITQSAYPTAGTLTIASIRLAEHG